jgi:hypothetical protein
MLMLRDLRDTIYHRALTGHSLHVPFSDRRSEAYMTTYIVVYGGPDHTFPSVIGRRDVEDLNGLRRY